MNWSLTQTTRRRIVGALRWGAAALILAVAASSAKAQCAAGGGGAAAAGGTTTGGATTTVSASTVSPLVGQFLQSQAAGQMQQVNFIDQIAAQHATVHWQTYQRQQAYLAQQAVRMQRRAAARQQYLMKQALIAHSQSALAAQGFVKGQPEQEVGPAIQTEAQRDAANRFWASRVSRPGLSPSQTSLAAAN